MAFVPNYTITQYFANGSETGFGYGGSLPAAFSYQFGSGLNYHINQVRSLIMNAGYTHSTAGYNDSHYYGGTLYHVAYTFAISSVNLSVGISYSL